MLTVFDWEQYFEQSIMCYDFECVWEERKQLVCVCVCVCVYIYIYIYIQILFFIYRFITVVICNLYFCFFLDFFGN